MRKLAVLVSVALGVTVLALTTPVRGQGFDPKVGDQLKKIAAALEKGDDATAKKLSTELAKKIEELNDVMHGFKLRSKKGLDVLGPRHFGFDVDYMPIEERVK